MRVISRAAIAEFSGEYPEALEALIHWYRATKRAAWKNLAEVHRDFPHADLVGAFTVFNIGGNRFRLVAAINYRWHIVYIRHILTHREYSRGKWKS